MVNKRKRAEKVSYRDLMERFSVNNLPNLNECVLGALELLGESSIPSLNISYQHPLIVGSRGAEITGRIIFSDNDAVFASETNFEKKLKSIVSIDGIVLISTSGEKGLPMVLRAAKKYKKRVTLITNNYHAKLKKLFDAKHKNYLFAFPHQREPYTYNTSTYLSMILGKTGENPEEIYKFINHRVSRIKFPQFSRYNKLYFIIPQKFSEMRRMFEIKLTELFGRKIAYTIETSDYVKHGTTIVPSGELFISFGEENKHFGIPKQRLFIPLPKNADYGAMMAVGYYIIGKIQESHPPYFKRYVAPYLEQITKIFKLDAGLIAP